MCELRYYKTVKDLEAGNLNYELVAPPYPTSSLAYGMRKKLNLQSPNRYRLNLMKVVKVN